LVSSKTRRLARLFVAGILCSHLVLLLTLLGHIERGYADFVVFYTGARVLREHLGHQLYVARVQNQVQKESTGELPFRPAALPYIHPPFEALFFVPVSRFSYRQALLMWDLLNLAALFGLALLLRPGIGILRLIPPWEFVLGSLAFFPIFECLFEGQDSILQLLFCVLAWKALEKEADVLAGCWFALGVFKFQLMIPIVLLIAVWKRRRVLIGFAAVSLVLGVISIELVGWEGLLRYPAFAVRVADTPSLGGVPANVMPNLHGFLMGWPFGIPGKIGTAIVILSSAGLFIFAATQGRLSAGTGKGCLQFSLAVAVAELIGWQTNIHDFTLLVLPLLLIADYCLQTPPGRNGRWNLLYPSLPILISPVWFVLWFVTGHVSLIAAPLLWWVWTLSREIRSSHRGSALSSREPELA
jgi:alpha-1,2-mannosyltransferase